MGSMPEFGWVMSGCPLAGNRGVAGAEAAADVFVAEGLEAGD
jgi:hypothetical protein